MEDPQQRGRLAVRCQCYDTAIQVRGADFSQLMFHNINSSSLRTVRGVVWRLLGPVIDIRLSFHV